MTVPTATSSRGRWCRPPRRRRWRSNTSPARRRSARRRARGSPPRRRISGSPPGGTRGPTATLVRLFGDSDTVFSAVVPSSKQQRHRRPGRLWRTCWQSARTSRALSVHRLPLRPAPSASPSPSPPASCAPRATRAVARPPHRPLDDDRHAVGRRHRRRHRGFGERRAQPREFLHVHPDRRSGCWRRSVYGFS